MGGPESLLEMFFLGITLNMPFQVIVVPLSETVLTFGIFFNSVPSQRESGRVRNPLQTTEVQT